MTEEKTITKHPLNKSSKSISKQKYDTIKDCIITALHDSELTHTELTNRVVEALTRKYDGNISWYTETVKLDLEAGKIITRTSSKPQKYKLA
jgi:hypothetical protein